MTAAGEVPVTITIGDRSWLAGSVPAFAAIPDEMIRPILDSLVRVVRSQVEHAAECLAVERDMAAILETQRAAMTLAIRTASAKRDPIGPMTKILRERAGMSRTDLARAMGRDPRSVAAWETGAPSRLTSWDDRMASRALGYADGALMAVYFDVLKAEPVPVPA